MSYPDTLDRPRPATVIAICLHNSGMVASLDDGERAVRHWFASEFAGHDFSRWNSEMDAAVAKHVVCTVGRASRINVILFIWDLWQDASTRPPRPDPR